MAGSHLTRIYQPEAAIRINGFMRKHAIIFGAGKTGRGFAAHLACLSGFEVVLVDKNENLVAAMREKRQYNIQVLGSETKNCSIQPLGIFHIEDRGWLDYFADAQVGFVSVFGNNLKELSESLATGLKQRFIQNSREKFNFITCENHANAAAWLRDCVVEQLPAGEPRQWLSDQIGFSEALVLRTCLDATVEQDPLTIRAQNFFELPCDGDAFKGDPPQVLGLKPLREFGNQLRRKIYTYNCINAVITYLGAMKGYAQLSEASDDAGINAVARKAAKETSDAQIAEFGFDPKDQSEWVEAAFAKFADVSIPDPIARNGADPARKLDRNDRLIGPALLALKHGISPDGLLAGILAGFEFFDAPRTFRLSDLVAKEGIDSVLHKVCQLDSDEPLSKMIKRAYLESVH